MLLKEIILVVLIGYVNTLPADSIKHYGQWYDPANDQLASTTTTPSYQRQLPVFHCGHRNDGNLDGFLRIVGGTDNTDINEFPWMVVILNKIDDQPSLYLYEGGGSLIHPSIVMTAAHRLHNKDIDKLKVRAGEWDTATKEELYPNQDRFVRQIIIHEDHKRATLVNNIALMFMDKPFILGENIGTVCLPPPMQSFNYETCTATGWGKDDYGPRGKYQNILKKINLPIVPNEQCEQTLRTTRLGPQYKLNPSFLCAGGETGKDTCTGDGGSPLICPISTLNPDVFYQVGIVAWGINCGLQIPGVYTNVAYLRNWIDNKVIAEGYNISSYTASKYDTQTESIIDQRIND